jgi:hypothetical protein
MEDLLALYEEPYDPLRPVICFDERPCQLLGEVLAPIPMKLGRAKRQDNEYERKGTCCILIAFEPLKGWRFVQVRRRRTALDYALFMQELVTRYYRGVDRIRLVQDNLNTHTPGAFYQALAPQDAFDLAQNFELHYTPLKGSWLNMAEIELSVLARQCLHRRIATEATLKRELAAVEATRNAAQATIDWQFTTAQARVKLHRLYPSTSL